MAATYATTADLALYGISAAALTGVGSPAQQAALDAAADLVDGYLHATFTLPLVAPYPKDLVMRVCEIAAWIAIRGRGFDPENGADMTIRKSYEDAIKWLRDIADDKVFPNVTDGTTGGTYAGHDGPFVQTITSTEDEDGTVVTTVGAPSPRGW